MGLTRKLTDEQILTLLKTLMIADPDMEPNGFAAEEKKLCDQWAIRECDVVRLFKTALQNFQSLMEEYGLSLYPNGWMCPVVGLGFQNVSKVVEPMKETAREMEAKYRTAVPNYNNERQYARRWVRAPI